MYTIGEFSKINRITTKTLRHYDKIDLLKPDNIDPWTGYRYYSPTQLTELREILYLREMGFPLEEIKSIRSGRESINNSLDMRIKELHQEIRDREERLKKVLEMKKSINGGISMSIEIKSLPQVTVASMRTTVPSYDTYFDIVPKMGEYMFEVGAICREPEYCFTIYHDGEFRDHDMDVEICEAVITKCEESERVKFKTIDSVPTAACVKHLGPYSTIQRAYNEVYTWIHENGYEVAGNPRESYIDGIWNREDPNQWLTEVQIPVIKED